MPHPHVHRLDGNGDLFGQLARALKHSVLEGRLPVGTRLPSTPPAGLLLGYAGLSPKQLAAAAALLGHCLDEIKRS